MIKIARLCGCLAYQGHNIYDVRSQPPEWCTWVRWFFFSFFFFKKKCWLLWTKLCFWFCFISSKWKQQIFHEWCRCSIMFDSFGFIFFVCLFLFVFFYFWTFVTLWWWRDVMWRWVLYYFCTFVYKPVKKSLNSNFLCMHTFLPHLRSKCFHWLHHHHPTNTHTYSHTHQPTPPPPPPPPPLYIFHRKGWFGKHTPTLLSFPSLSSKPGPTQIPILSFCHSSGLILSLPG